MPSRRKWCLRCHKRDHNVAQCPSKKPKRVSGLAELPAELIDQIATYLIEGDHGISYLGWRIWNLRLTCRALHQKTYEIFAKAAYGQLLVHVSSRGLARLSWISQSPMLAKHVQWIMLSQCDKIGREELEAAEAIAESTEHSKSKRRDAQRLVRLALRERDDKDYIERSGTASIVLAAALPLFQNLREVVIRCDENYPQRSDVSLSADRAFSMISAGLLNSDVRLQTLSCMTFGLNKDENLSLQSLSMPRNARASFSELRVLKLGLTTGNDHYRNPQKWQTNAATFLANCPQLRELEFGFNHKDWEDTAGVFEHVAKSVTIPHLQRLELKSMRCMGEDLQLFLAKHQRVETLSLRDLDIMGPVAITEILQLLQRSVLQDFSCRQIAQNSFRLYFEQHGLVDFQSSPTYRGSLNETPDFFDDFVDVVGPFRYTGKAEEWEGVQAKIGILRDDIRVSGRTYHPDPISRQFGHYIWGSGGSDP